MASALICEFLWKHKGEILTAFVFILFFILWFTAERLSDKIDYLNREIENRDQEIAALKDELKSVKASVVGVKLYIEQLHVISTNEQQELKENENICQSVTDFNSIVPRLNELFGHCSE